MEDGDVHFFYNITLARHGTVNASIPEIQLSPQTYYNAGDLAWLMTSSGLVFLMVLGLSLFYSGISDTKITHSMALLPLMTAAVIGVQWHLWGYSIAFCNRPTSSTLWGSTDGVALHQSLLQPMPSNEAVSQKAPEMLFVLFEGMFASFTAALVAGAAAWKDRLGHFLVFILIWSTLVYDEIVRWTWNPEGWSNQLGVMDFAGGSPVHICAGSTVLAHSLYHLYVLPRIEALLSRKKSEPPRAGILASFGPSPGETSNASLTLASDPTIVTSNNTVAEMSTNHTNVLCGTLLIWIGWFGFNGGSALGANMRAVSACLSTQFAACFGAVVLCVGRSMKNWLTSGDEYLVFSINDFCNGAITGMVAITPGAGFVPPQIAPVFGIVAALLTWPASYLSEMVNDSQYLFSVHAVGGLVGVVLTGVFAHGEISALDGVTNPTKFTGGWDGNWRQVGIQLAAGLATLAYSFLATMAILIVLEPIMFYLRKIRERNAPARSADSKVGDDTMVLEVIQEK